MERLELASIVKTLKAVYTDPKFIPTQDSFDVWYIMLQDIPEPVMKSVATAYIASNKFPPTISDIRELARKLTTPKTEMLTEMEAWNLVRKALSNSGYCSKEEFDKLPKDIQDVIGSPEYLYRLAMSNDANMSVESSNFMRSYKRHMEKKEELALLPDNMRRAAESLSASTDAGQNLIGEKS